MPDAVYALVEIPGCLLREVYNFTSQTKTICPLHVVDMSVSPE